MKTNHKPQSILYPQPVLVITSYDKEGKADAMVAAWGGIYDTNQIGFMLDHHHQTTENIKESGAFTVSMATVDTMAASDYFREMRVLNVVVAINDYRPFYVVLVRAEHKAPLIVFLIRQRHYRHRESVYHHQTEPVYSC